MITIVTCSLPEHLDGISQSAIAVAIQIGVWLIEYDEDRPAKKRTGQSDALPLAAGKTGSVFPYDGVVALREPLDHGMRRGQLRRLDDLFIRGSVTKAGDVVANGAGEQFDILRQVAEALTEEVGVEVPYVISVDAHATVRGRPRPNQGARQ